MEEQKKRKCGVCGEPGHTRRTCPGLKVDKPCESCGNVMKGVPADATWCSGKCAPKSQNAVKPTTAVGGSDKGPWFGAQFPGICESCGNGFEEGDMIRADGNGGWECHEWCGQDDSAEEPTCCDECQDGPQEPKNWERPTAANVKIPRQTEESRAAESAPDWADQAMAFLATPGPSLPEPESAPERKQKDRYGYLIIDPQTGEFRRWKKGTVQGITRCTTFVKAASDRTALSDWGKRNVLKGASLRPDLVLKAHGLDVSEDKAAMMDLVEQLENAAGAKVSASIGTAVHDLTERIDRGEIGIVDVPAAYRGHVQSYRDALIEAGLSVVPDLIEQTIFFPKYGGVAGTFDRILYHTASDSYLMADLKTGKDLSYGWDEIEAQEYVYACGYNEFGTYVWGDAHDGSQDDWEPPQHQVRMDRGVVMWLPIQGPNAGTCTLLMTDLERGKRKAKRCGGVRADRANKPKPEPWTGLSSAGRGLDVVAPWFSRFNNVRNAEEAARVWQEARDAGVPKTDLDALVGLARRALGAE